MGRRVRIVIYLDELRAICRALLTSPNHLIGKDLQ